MSGTIKGLIEAKYTAATLDSNAVDMMSNLKTFVQALVAAGYATMIASNYGGGAGFGFYDAADPCGNNAWFVFKMNAAGSARDFDYYILIQYSGSNNFGSSPGDPGLILGTTGTSGAQIGVQVAVAWTSGGATTSPWNGTTDNDGADTKGTPVWVAPEGGSVQVLPMSNNGASEFYGAGDYATNRQNCMPLFSQLSGTSNWRTQFVADRDSLTFLFDYGDDGSYSSAGVVGIYEPADDMVGSNACPLFAVYTTTLPLDAAGNIGSTVGTSAPEGGILHPTKTGVPASVIFHLPWSSWATAAYHPNLAFGTGYDAIDQPIYIGNTVVRAFMGTCAWLKSVYNIAQHDTNTALTRVAVNTTATLAQTRYLLGWDGATAPRSGAARAGVSF